MGNYALIGSPTQMILGQANQRMRMLLADLANGTIDSQPALLAEASALFNAFYANLGAPLVKPMDFTGLPSAEDWNAYQELLAADLAILYAECINISQSTTGQIAFETIENRMLAAAAAHLHAKVSAFIPTRPTTTGLQSWIVTDTFTNASRIDSQSSTGLTVLINTIELQRTGELDQSAAVALSIDDTYIAAANGTAATTGSSNGFLGNLHEVVIPDNTNTLTNASAADNAIAQAVQLNATPGEAIAFAGDGDLHSDIAALTDGKATTWLEYEVCNIPDALRSNPTLGYGFTINVPQLTGSSDTTVPWYAFHNQATAPATSFFPTLPTTGKLSVGVPEVSSTGQFNTPAGVSVVDPTTGLSNTASPATGTVTLNSSGAPQTGGVLRLVLNGALKVPQLLTHISITPNILNNMPPAIVSVKVRSSDAAIWVDANPLNPTNSAQLVSIATPTAGTAPSEVWTFPQTLTAFVQIVIEQTQAYNANIGHIVWVEQDTITAGADPAVLDTLLGQSVLLDNATDIAVNYSRIDGPNPSLSNVLTNARQTVQNTINGLSSYIPASSSPSGTAQIGPLIESFAGWRYAIAIRDIAFETISYTTTGVLVSTDTVTPIDIKSVALEVSEDVPSADSTIAYEISLDAGRTFTEISPSSHFGASAPQLFQVNPTGGTIPAGVIVTNGYDPITAPANIIRLRATFKRPTSDASQTPRLHSYSLKLEGNAL